MTYEPVHSVLCLEYIDCVWCAYLMKVLPTSLLVPPAVLRVLMTVMVVVVMMMMVVVVVVVVVAGVG